MRATPKVLERRKQNRIAARRARQRHKQKMMMLKARVGRLEAEKADMREYALTMAQHVRRVEKEIARIRRLYLLQSARVLRLAVKMSRE